MTAYQPQYDSMIQRFHRHLKVALRSRLTGDNWPSHLPWNLLGLWAAPKEDSNILLTELVYGFPLILLRNFYLHLILHWETLSRGCEQWWLRRLLLGYCLKRHELSASHGHERRWYKKRLHYKQGNRYRLHYNQGNRYRIGHCVLFHSECSVLFRSFKECNVLFHSFFEFLVTYETQKNDAVRVADRLIIFPY